MNHNNTKKLLATLLALAGITAQAQVPADPYNHARTSSFEYYGPGDGALNGLLKSETVEPDNAQLCVKTTYTYDTHGNKTGATTANCAGATGRAVFTSRTSATTYAAVASQTIQVNGSNTTVAIAAGIFATSATNALNQSETRTYDPRFGQPLSLTGPNALTTTWQLDDFGRKTRETRADGTSTVMQYCVLATSGLDTSANTPGCPTPAAGEAPAGAVMFTHSEPRNTADAKMGPFVRVYTDALGREIRTTTESFDGANQPTARRGALIAKDTVYNAHGAKKYETQPYFLLSVSSTTAGSNDVGVTRIDYDVLGRPVDIYVADPNGSQTNVTFGPYGSRTAAKQTFSYSGTATVSTNDKGQVQMEEKNVLGEIIRVSNHAGASIVHQRDAFGNLVKTKDALQNVITVAYDIRGRKVSLTDPDTGWWEYDYDALGQLVWQRSPNQRALGQQTTMAYDKLGRMTQRVEPEYTSTWHYDAYANASACPKGIGKLCESTTSNGITKKFVYDSLGRPSSSRVTITSGPSFGAAVAYDAATGKVTSQTYPTGLRVGYLYTGLGHLDKVRLITGATVNPLPATPGGTAGASTTIGANSVLWQAQIVNAWGKAEQSLTHNGVVTKATYEAATGRTTDLTAGIGAATGVLSHHYVWDSLNNLTGRNDTNGDGSTGAVTETFSYGDQLNRLTSYTVAAPGIPGLSRTVNLQYNALGMLLSKSDVGVYSYGAQGPGSVRPHALQSMTPTGGGTATTYTYDANGNLTAASGGKYRSISYTSFNLPDSQNGLAGPSGTPRYTWQYDENHQRVKETRTNASGTRTTWSLHPDNVGGLSFESETASGGALNHRHYVTAAGQVIAVLVSNGALPTLSSTATAPPALSSITLSKVEYWHKDHLGSLAATTDHTGALTARYAYDPFGKRRFTNGSYDASGNLVVDWTTNTNHGTDRGYTGHEHLDDVGLVHMNGRIFDPTLGVFLQGDPLIQDPNNLQNYNRYGYCYNNPLTCTDPSGHSFFRSLVRTFVDIGYSLSPLKWMGIVDRKTYQQLLSIAAAVALGPGGMYSTGLFGGVVTGYGQAAVAGFASGAIASDGSFKGALQGAFSGALFYGVGQNFGQGWMTETGKVTDYGKFATAVAMHGVAGCVSSVAGGGKCGTGALSAGFSKAAVPFTVGLGDVGGTIASAVIGGTASELGGGKFANGAVTGAFSYIFNQVVSNEAARAAEEARNRAVMRGACMPGFENRCAGITAGTPEEQAKAAAATAVAAKLADATDQAAAAVATGCVATANPCAVPAAGISLAAKTTSLVLAPPGPREASVGALSEFAQASMQRLVMSSPALFFFSTGAIVVGSEALKPKLQAIDNAAKSGIGAK